MGHVSKTPSGTFRANWRDQAGRQKAKTFKTKKEASAYLSDIEQNLNRGTYIDPKAGKLLFRTHATRWLDARHVETRTAERTLSVLRIHVIPKWGDWPLSSIDHLSVQGWVNELARKLSPASVVKCFSALSGILASAVRARLIPFNPCEGISLPSTHRAQRPAEAISREDFFGKLLPVVPEEYRAVVALAGGAGLRWGEAVGLAWSAVDFERGAVRVVQTVIETGGMRTIKPFPKSKAGVRTIPMPAFLSKLLKAQRDRAGDGYGPTSLVFTGRTGEPLLRASFRRDVWRPALVRAGLLGNVTEQAPKDWRAAWADASGAEWTKDFPTEREAVTHVADHAAGGLRFHDLRHSFATWCVTDGVPVNVLRTIMGHEAASTTLNLYTHAPSDFDKRVRDVFREPADDPLTEEDEN